MKSKEYTGRDKAIPESIFFGPVSSLAEDDV
jgi:hypothetical protein